MSYKSESILVWFFHIYFLYSVVLWTHATQYPAHYSSCGPSSSTSSTRQVNWLRYRLFSGTIWTRWLSSSSACGIDVPGMVLHQILREKVGWNGQYASSNQKFASTHDLTLLTSSITEFVSTSLEEGLPYCSSDDAFSASPTQQYEGGELQRERKVRRNWKWECSTEHTRVEYLQIS